MVAVLARDREQDDADTDFSELRLVAFTATKGSQLSPMGEIEARLFDLNVYDVLEFDGSDFAFTLGDAEGERDGAEVTILVLEAGETRLSHMAVGVRKARGDRLVSSLGAAGE
mmetsp:Transcript_20859/g.34245  ORF Transcript_20859/g.34245 Transcript_20859/m.34245 type:complete len:113 (+) Transcript_20859:622-960(+)